MRGPTCWLPRSTRRLRRRPCRRVRKEPDSVPVKTEAVGKSYPATSYAVGREKIREYAYAVGETDPVYLDVDAARAAGHADVVAPPMFAVVFSSRAMMPGMFDPD